MILHHYAPLPPLPNGIADYAFRLNAELQKRVVLRCITADAQSRLPKGGERVDPADIEALNAPEALPLYQIGNNRDHIDIYKMALQKPGVVILHDLRLYYLHELMGTRAEEFDALCAQSNPILARIRREDVVEKRQKMRSDYLWFDALGPLLRRSRAVVVHSRYAKSLLARHHGRAVAERIHVLPHFALAPERRRLMPKRWSLRLAPATTLIVTSGFATEAKRFDWVAESLARLIARGHKLFWLHAGKERPEEYDLGAAMAKYPALAACSKVTGYLEEAELDHWLQAADIVLNLRFPSVGESSGTLARAMAMGRCCVVNATAAYNELPDEAVVKTSVYAGADDLTRTLSVLLDHPELRSAFGKNAKTYAKDRLGLAGFAEALVAICQKARGLEPLAGENPLERALRPDRADLGEFAPEALDRAGLEAALPEGFVARSYHFAPSARGRVKVVAKGAALGRPTPL